MENFDSLGLPQQLNQALTAMKFATPTPIQAQAIPLALNGRDILGSAQTGTGKTAAFAIPMIAHLLKNPDSMGLVMTPTRELAVQVMQTMLSLLKYAPTIKTAVLIGGEPIQRQFRQLQANPRLIVGTPGRINDHLNRRSINLGRADMLVLDETDRMLDMGFGVQIDRVLTHVAQKRQTLLFSATLPSHITKLADRYQNKPERIAIGSTTTPMASIKQDIVRTTVDGKYMALVAELTARAGTVIVFVKTKHGADRLAMRLSRENHSAEAIHGDLKQNRRDRVIKDFREKKHRILVATDVAARGLDIPHIEHVINYDLPQCPEDYIHRVGRTGRAGATGSAVCLITGEDHGKWNAIQRLIDPSAKPEPHRGGAPSNNGKRSGKPRRSGGGGKDNRGGFKFKQHSRGEGRGNDRNDNRGGDRVRPAQKAA